MKQLCTTITCLLISFLLYSQDVKTSVAIMPFTYALPEYKNRASQLQEIVAQFLARKSDINLIDRSKDTLLMKELDNQIREQSILSDKLVQQGKVLGAQNIIIGTLSNVDVTQQTNNAKNLLTGKFNNTTTFVANISFSLQLTDVETGKIINQKAFSSTDKSGGMLSFPTPGIGSSREDALEKAMSAKSKDILMWINQCYPPKIKILKIEDRDKKGFPATILVSGIDGSLAVGTKLALNEVEMFDAGDGKQLRRSKNIGTLKIADKQDQITVCKIIDGEKDVEGKMTSNAKLEVLVK